MKKSWRALRLSTTSSKPSSAALEPPVTTEFPRYHVGAPEELRDKLIDMASQLGVEELMIVTIVHDHRARMRSYELLAKAFDLKPRA